MRTLTQLLTDHAARDGRGPDRVPRVVELGEEDLLTWERSPVSESGDPRPDVRDADIFLTSRAVLVLRRGSERACGHCLALRLQRMQPAHERDLLEIGSGTQRVGTWPDIGEQLAVAVWACFNQADQARATELSQVWRVDLRTLMVTASQLLRDARCPSCGDRDPEPPDIDLGIVRKPSPTEYRVRRPEDYAIPIKALVNPVCGVLAPGTSLSLGSPTTAPVVGAASVRGPIGLHDLSWSGQANSYAASSRLALFEGLERHAGTMRRRPGLVVGSYTELADRTLTLNPGECATYSPESYTTDDHLTPFDPDRPIPWVTGYSLRDKRPILVPVRLAFYGWDGGSELFAFECSNGCASGGCLAEAVLFGLLELIERDAFLLAWYGGAELPEIDTASLDGTARAMLNRARLQGYEVRLFDNRIDLPVPVVTGVARRTDGGDGLFSFAAGAGMDPESAAEAALGEILTYIPSMRHRVQARREELQAMAQDFALVSGLADHPALFGLPEMAEHARHYTRDADPVPVSELYQDWLRVRPATDDLADDVRFLVDEVVRAGSDVIVVDQTSAEQRAAGLSGVRVIAPGLVPIDFGWGRQRAPRVPRMFTALRRAGLRDADLTAADLHLVPHPFP
ncbi:TOMM precursor leader peptide-binding protein [Catenulispora rubra]|uniref:TOMM precursor leader peptide-binding protein n=1 Tax=Catenulispora rubra TaxID=280293 RepID=UPI001892477E|nr:TOMM precursor leader peptide-binding protein [Catenulispora rubra]